MSVVYLVHATGTNRFKIGFATNIKKRLSGIQTSCPFKLELVEMIDGTIKDERRLHKLFAKFRRQGEWFEFPSVAEAQRRFLQRKRSKEQIAAARAGARVERILAVAQATVNNVFKDMGMSARTAGVKRLEAGPGTMWWELAKLAVENDLRINRLECQRILVNRLPGCTYEPVEPLLVTHDFKSERTPPEYLQSNRVNLR